MNRDFDRLVDVEGMTPDERARLERVHDLLVAAGPPSELPTGLEQPPAQVIQFPVWRRRSPLVAAFAAAVAVAAAAFGGGYFVGHENGMHITQVVALRGGQNELASLRVGPSDRVGNTPMILSVKGLPEQDDHGYYELFTWRDGKPSFPCTGFKMIGGKTTVHFTVPYELQPGTKLVITFVERGKVDWPGKVVMRSAETV
jgi:hypothetical protein